MSRVYEMKTHSNLKGLTKCEFCKTIPKVRKKVCPVPSKQKNKMIYKIWYSLSCCNIGNIVHCRQTIGKTRKEVRINWNNRDQERYKDLIKEDN